MFFSIVFDKPCHSWVDGHQLDPSSGICQANVTIPANTPSGLYQFVWYWPFRYAGNSVIEDYTSCWDVQVTGTAAPQSTTTTATSTTTTTASTVSTSTTSSASTTSSSTTTGSADYSTTASSQSESTTTTTTGSVNPVSSYLTPTDGIPGPLFTLITKDSYVKGGAFSSINYDFYNLMIAGNSDNNQIMESYLRFNLSSLATKIGSLQLYLTKYKTEYIVF